MYFQIQLELLEHALLWLNKVFLFVSLWRPDSESFGICNQSVLWSADLSRCPKSSCAICIIANCRSVRGKRHGVWEIVCTEEGVKKEREKEWRKKVIGRDGSWKGKKERNWVKFRESEREKERKRVEEWRTKERNIYTDICFNTYKTCIPAHTSIRFLCSPFPS